MDRNYEIAGRVSSNPKLVVWIYLLRLEIALKK
jgi:hypothetical protein